MASMENQFTLSLSVFAITICERLKLNVMLTPSAAFFSSVSWRTLSAVSETNIVTKKDVEGGAHG